jgi:hypothetical protein
LAGSDVVEVLRPQSALERACPPQCRWNEELPVGDETDRGAATGWWGQDGVADRMPVWVAVGILMERTRQSNRDALAVLRR